MALNSATLVDFSVSNLQLPKEGPRTIPVQLDFTAQQSYTFDLTLVQQQKKVSFIQTLYIDNGANPQPITILFGTTQQSITIGPNVQGFIPVLASGEPKLTISTTGGVVIEIQLLNFPVGAAVWYTTAQAGTVVAGKQQVTDPILDGTVSGGFVQTSMFDTASGAIVKPFWKGDKVASLITAAVGPTAIIPAQGAGDGWFISHLNVSLSGNASQAVAGDFTVTLTDTGGAGTLFTKTIFVPNAAGTILGDVSLFNFDDLGINAKVANNTFVVTLSAALATGHLNINAAWGITTIVT